MIPNPNNHVKIARHSAMRPGIPFSRNADPLPIARSRLDADFQRFSPLHRPFPMAHRAIGDILSRPMTSRTLRIELHAPAGLRNLTAASALRTLAWRFDVSPPMTVGAGDASRDVQAHHATANGCPERHIDLILEVTPRFRAFFGSCSAPPAEHAREDVAETTSSAGTSPPTATLEEIGKIEAPEIKRHSLTRASHLPARKSAKPASSGWPPASICLGGRGIDVVRIKPKLVVNLALLRVSQNVVGFGKDLKLFFGTFIPGIDVRMILARKFAKRLANLVRRSRLLHSQCFVIILFSRCRHYLTIDTGIAHFLSSRTQSKDPAAI